LIVAGHSWPAVDSRSATAAVQPPTTVEGETLDEYLARETARREYGIVNVGPPLSL
jgi:hypothetical protein